MKILLLGLDIYNANKGCVALGYSFLEILNTIAKEKGDTFDIYISRAISRRQLIKNKFSIKKYKKSLPKIESFSNLRLNHWLFLLYGRKRNKVLFHRNIKTFDVAFDFTGGDSFSDIYGERRFYSDAALKTKIIKKGVPFVLGSQTIGPFKDKKVREEAARIIKSSYEVFVRDKMSYDYVLDNFNRKPILTTDVAFILPYRKQNLNHNKTLIGFNVSGLLWLGGYNQENQFDLKLDYVKYCKCFLEKFANDSSYEVHLIPHSFHDQPIGLDNDYRACFELKQLFPNVKIAPLYETPGEIKGYIAGMDIFFGARMHATIGALSAGVPVIPISYSRKFEGLFHNLGYTYLIDAKKLTTEEALNLSFDYIERRKDILEEVLNVKEKLKSNIAEMIEKYSASLHSLQNN